jgi:hypothetical protein
LGKPAAGLKIIIIIIIIKPPIRIAGAEIVGS